MSKSLYWLQCGSCGGDSMALLNMESPNVVDLRALLGVEVLWHPSFSGLDQIDHDALMQAILRGERPLDLLVVEGAIIRGPGGTGMYDTHGGRPRKDLVAELARRADYVVAAGTCAAFGGFGAEGDIDATGLQFHKRRPGAFSAPASARGPGCR